MPLTRCIFILRPFRRRARPGAAHGEAHLGAHCRSIGRVLGITRSLRPRDQIGEFDEPHQVTFDSPLALSINPIATSTGRRKSPWRQKQRASTAKKKSKKKKTKKTLSTLRGGRGGGEIRQMDAGVVRPAIISPALFRR